MVTVSGQFELCGRSGRAADERSSCAIEAAAVRLRQAFQIVQRFPTNPPANLTRCCVFHFGLLGIGHLVPGKSWLPHKHNATKGVGHKTTADTQSDGHRRMCHYCDGTRHDENHYDADRYHGSAGKDPSVIEDLNPRQVMYVIKL